MRQQEQILNYQFPDTTDIERLVLADAVSAPELLGAVAAVFPAVQGIRRCGGGLGAILQQVHRVREGGAQHHPGGRGQPGGSQCRPLFPILLHGPAPFHHAAQFSPVFYLPHRQLARGGRERKILNRKETPPSAIIMSTEETALRFLRTAVAAFSPLEEAVLRRETHSRPGGRFCPERRTQCPRNPSPK